MDEVFCYIGEQICKLLGKDKGLYVVAQVVCIEGVKDVRFTCYIPNDSLL